MCNFKILFQLTIPTVERIGELEAGNGLFRGHINRRLLIPILLGDLTGFTVDSVCSLIGPDFLQAIVSSNNCPSVVKLPNAFHSHKDFCELYNRECPDANNCCLTDRAVQSKIDIRGIVRVDIVVAKCCKRCDSNPPQYSVLGGNLDRNLLDGELSSNNLVGSLVKNVEGELNGLMCSFLGPDFLQVLTSSKKCPPITLLHRNLINSCEKFCSLYDHANPSLKECFTDAVIRISGDVVVNNGHTKIGRCCAFCASKNKGTLNVT